jgi:endonuclease/exonuclease/phosphatase family metal-dependent hydrolase
MRRVLTATVAAASLACAQGCAAALNYDDPAGPVLIGQRPSSRLSTSEIRLVTFNVKFGEHVDRAADLLTRPGPLTDADVLFLQEMDGPGTEKLACALAMNSVYVPSARHPTSHRDFGVAVLSPWPLDDARKVPLPREHRFRKLRRAAVAATVHTPAGVVRVYSVHFETAFGLWSKRHRRDQARAVLADAATWPGPVAIAGDFNGRGPADEVARAGYSWLTRTLEDRGLFFDFDHVLVRGLCPTGDRPAAHAADVTGASDHRPVWAIVRPCAVP